MSKTIPGGSHWPSPLTGSRVEPSFPLIGLAGELQRLSNAIGERKPLLILGPGGSGKSKLISTLLDCMPASEGIISIPYAPVLHHLLVDLARALLEANHKAFEIRAKPDVTAEPWLLRQTSSHLKGLLWEALEAEPRPILLDGVVGATFPAYRFLQRLYHVQGLSLIVSARDPVSLAALARLFWDPRNTIHLRPLNGEESNRLFRLAVDRFGIGHLNVEDFRRKALAAAMGNPGQILEMCRLAANPIYVSGGHIKFAPLRIDALMRFL